MEYEAKSLTEKSSSEFEKRIAVSVFEGIETAKLAVSSRFSDTRRRESSCGTPPRGEGVRESEAEARTVRIIPPPPHCFSLWHARAFLLFLVLAAGVSSLPPDASAQHRIIHRAGLGHNVRGVSSAALQNMRGAQSITLNPITTAQFNFLRLYACSKTETPRDASAAYRSPTCSSTILTNCCTVVSTTDPNNRLPAGSSVTLNIDVTPAMIANGGAVIVLERAVGSASIQFGQWVPIPPPEIVVSPSAGLSLEEGGSGTYTVNLSARPTDDVTIFVASNNAGVAVKKEGSDTAGTRQELTFNAAASGPGSWNVARTVTVEALSDDNLLDERAIVSHQVLSGSAPESVGRTANVNLNVNVMDDDYPGLMITGAEALESEKTLDFTVRLNDASSRRVVVDWMLVAAGPGAGTATPGTATGGDYDSSVAGGTLVFSEGSPRTQTISFPINDDRLSEGDETVKVSLSVRSPSQVRVSGSSVATGTIVDDDERTVVGAMSGEFSLGDTTVTVNSTLSEDPGLEVSLPSKLESGGESIEELVVTLRETDAEIDADRFGYTGDDADHVLADIDVSPAPDAAVRICLPVTEGLRGAAGERRIYIVRFSGGSWQELSSTTEGEMVCADASGFSPFAVVYERMNMNMGAGSGSGGCAISSENGFTSPVLLTMTLLTSLLFFDRFRKSRKGCNQFFLFDKTGSLR